MYKITISIVTYNHTVAQISNILNSINLEDYCKVYIVDNSSNSNLKEIENYFIVKYVKTNENLGFGAAHNIAIEKAFKTGASYHIVINPDIYFEEGLVEKLVKYMDENLDVGLLMPKILYPNGKIQHLPKLLPNPFDLLIRRISFLRKRFKFRLEKYELSFESEIKSYETPIISGCFSLFRIQVLKEVGLYDGRFFMYFEDFDLSRRVNSYCKTYYYSEASVYHEYERGAQKSLRLFIIFIQSAIKYFNKWGWFFDRKRKEINKLTLKQFKE